MKKLLIITLLGTISLVGFLTIPAINLLCKGNIQKLANKKFLADKELIENKQIITKEKFYAGGGVTALETPSMSKAEFYKKKLKSTKVGLPIVNSLEEEAYYVAKDKEEKLKVAENEQVTKNKINQSMFGIFLGESLKSLRERIEVFSSGLVFTDKDNPGKIWTIQNHNPNVKELSIQTLDAKIYTIRIQFMDTSEANYEAIKTQLEKKYKGNDDSLFGDLFGETKFITTIDTIKIHIYLNRDIGFMEDDKLELSYTHIPLFKKVLKEIQRRKTNKISNEL